MKKFAALLSILLAGAAFAAVYDLWFQRIGTNGVQGEYVQYTFGNNVFVDNINRIIYTTNNPPTFARTRATTDANGNYTWTYGITFSNAPAISCLAEGGSTVPLTAQLVGVPTTTNCVLKVMSLPSTSVLGIVVLGAPQGTQATIDLIATSI
jgi:hypothetical protein